MSQSQQKPSWQHWLIIMAVIIIFVIAKILLFTQYPQPATTALPLEESACQLQRGCRLANGSVIRFVGKPSTKIPFQIVIDHIPAATEPVYISFSMKDMDMGFNRYKLMPHPQHANQRYADNVKLPICIVARTDYLMDITLGDNHYRIPFEAR